MHAPSLQPKHFQELAKDSGIDRDLQELISTVLQTGGLIIAQDADLSDLSLDYLKGLAGIPNSKNNLKSETKKLNLSEIKL